MFVINKLLHGWLVCTIFIMHLLLKIAKLTRSLRSLVRLAIFHNSCIKIVRTRQPCSNLYLLHDGARLSMFILTSCSLEYMDIGLGMMMDGVAFIQAKLMESLSNIAGDMSKQITTLSEYDTSDIKGLLDDVDPVPVRNFVEEAKPKIGEFIDEMQKMAKKYLDVGAEKAMEAKDEIESEVCVCHTLRSTPGSRTIAASPLQACYLIKLISGCVRIACSGLMTASLLQVVNSLDAS